ncbi:MAG: DUF3387 domain-containing protein [Kiritimatiellales bacterium]|nr:DUF3387 domain-containing protein [Kiritimatiellales bacterium]
MKHGLVTYTESSRKGDPITYSTQAIAVMVQSNMFSYPPDLPEEPVETVLAQPELLCMERA